MKLILTRDVPHLGTIGDVVMVKPGYGRNYLLPRQFALLANRENTRQLEHHRRILAKKKELFLAEKRALAKNIEKLTLVLEKQEGEDGKIFGSVTSAELVALAQASGVTLDRKTLVVPDVRQLGSYEAEVKLHAEVTARLKFTVSAAPTGNSEQPSA